MLVEVRKSGNSGDPVVRGQYRGSLASVNESPPKSIFTTMTTHISVDCKEERKKNVSESPRHKSRTFDTYLIHDDDGTSSERGSIVFE